MSNPKLSIVTVCRNVLPALQRTAESVCTQTFTDYEYIVVDGASTDGTTEWLQNRQDILWHSEPDDGIYDAMNKGVCRAKGEWIIFMNAGDTFYDNEVLRHTVPYLQDGLGLVYGDIVKERHGRLVVKRAELPHNAHRMFFCHQALFTRTQLLREMPFDTRHRFSADFKFVKQALQRQIAMRHIPLVIAHFDTSGISNTHVNDGLRDNIAVVREMDTKASRTWFVLRLQARIFWNTIRGRQ